MAVIKSGKGTDQWTIDPTSKAGRVTLYDTAGNPVMVETGYGGNKYLGVCMNQDVEPSTVNTSTANINAGATWSGTGESSLGIAGIQVNTFLDKQHIVTVYQSNDNSNWRISDSWTVPANFGASRTVQATASYFYVAVKNNTAANTTVVDIATALCPVVEALPRSLTSGGNLKVSVQAEWQGADRMTGLYAVSSFRTIGDTNATQNIFTIENPAASTVGIAVRGLNVVTDSTAALTSVAQQLKLSRPTGLPTGGTALTPTKYQTGYAAPIGIVRGGTASDGGGATAITATAGSTLWSQFIDKFYTVVGMFSHQNYNLIPDVGADLRQIILLPGEALLIQGVTAIPATTHVVVNCSWIEYKYL
jgi:hypothetical protein